MTKVFFLRKNDKSKRTYESNFVTIFRRETFSNVLNMSAKNCEKTQEFKHKLNKFECRIFF